MKFLWMVMPNFGVAYFKDSTEKFMDLNSFMSYWTLFAEYSNWVHYSKLQGRLGLILGYSKEA